METFWMIWNEKGTAPRVKHTCIRAAKREAERLARLNPGERFIVLEAIGSCIKRDVEWNNEQQAKLIQWRCFMIKTDPTMLVCNHTAGPWVVEMEE